ncbi:DNA-processing protein DprA, partial [Streptococcus pyogenes]
MNNFEIFKLKKAGLSNLQVHKVLTYREKTGKSLSLRTVALVSETTKASLFMEN